MRVPFLCIDIDDIDVLNRRSLDAAVFELGRLGLWRKDASEGWGKACLGIQLGWWWEPARLCHSEMLHGGVRASLPLGLPLS